MRNESTVIVNVAHLNQTERTVRSIPLLPANLVADLYLSDVFELVCHESTNFPWSLPLTTHLLYNAPGLLSSIILNASLISYRLFSGYAVGSVIGDVPLCVPLFLKRMCCM